MASLFNYMKDCQRFLRDAGQEFLNPENLITFINRARREVAMRAQCIRVLPPISGSIMGWTITNGENETGRKKRCLNAKISVKISISFFTIFIFLDA